MYPLGHTINGSPHSVCVSLPTMADVIGYEEKRPEVISMMRSGYPRFVSHELVEKLARVLEEEYALAPRKLLLTASAKSAHDLLAWVGSAAELFDGGGYHGVTVLAEDSEALIRGRKFLQHTGVGISSREAEDGLGQGNTPEPSLPRDPENRIRQQLAELYRAGSPEDIFLTRGGMNAFYAGFLALRDLQAAAGRIHWVQLGWLYVDTACILEKMLPPGGRIICWYDVKDLEGLKKVVDELGDTVAGIVTETPTNPLMQTCDLPALHEFARERGIGLMLDPTMVSPHNVNILPYSDVHINSLTKYAGNQGDVLVGALALNQESPFYAGLRAAVPHLVERPCNRDLARLAYQMQDYSSFVHQANANTHEVVRFLKAHPNVDRVWWALQDSCAENFQKIAHKDGGPGCIVSFTTHTPLDRFYDRVQLAKSPSFGTAFTMLCPFMFMAHYDLASTREGRQKLIEIGLHPDLIRVSVGAEPASEIIAALDAALR